MKKVRKFEKIEIHKMFSYDFPDPLEWRKYVFEVQNQFLKHLKVRKKNLKMKKSKWVRTPDLPHAILHHIPAANRRLKSTALQGSEESTTRKEWSPRRQCIKIRGRSQIFRWRFPDSQAPVRARNFRIHSQKPLLSDYQFIENSQPMSKNDSLVRPVPS